MKPKKIGTMTTVDAETGEVIEVKRNAGMLLPPPANTCQECAVDHPWNEPHNQQSLYYQMQFHAKHARWPTWTDAMAHCPDDVKAAWREHLVSVMTKNNMPIPDDLRNEQTGGVGR